MRENEDAVVPAERLLGRDDRDRIQDRRGKQKRHGFAHGQPAEDQPAGQGNIAAFADRKQHAQQGKHRPPQRRTRRQPAEQEPAGSQTCTPIESRMPRKTKGRDSITTLIESVKKSCTAPLGPARRPQDKRPGGDATMSNQRRRQHENNSTRSPSGIASR